ncbi:Protein of unknown function, partial [Gryllus bimaculatus]
MEGSALQALRLTPAAASRVSGPRTGANEGECRKLFGQSVHRVDLIPPRLDRSSGDGGRDGDARVVQVTPASARRTVGRNEQKEERKKNFRRKTEFPHDDESINVNSR